MARYPRWSMVAGASLALVLGGCSDGGTPYTGRPGDAVPSQDRPTTPGNEPELDNAWQSEADDAVAVVDNFWKTHWNDSFTGAYSSPQVFGAYTPDSPQAPSCGQQPAVPDNAFYCPSEDFIAWDAGLMRDGYRTGDSWVYLVIAHEWGHAVQNRVLGLASVAHELQADCLAGATLFGSEDLEFEAGDTDELAAGLTALADETPWTNSSDHGDASERITAFSNGGRDGVEACLPT